MTNIQYEEFNYSINKCSNCENNKELEVLSVVNEIGRHNGEKREFKGGGAVIGEKKVRCIDCEEVLWNGSISIDKSNENNWEKGERCCFCGNKFIEEHHIDALYRDFNGNFIHSGDRIKTLLYKCRSCDRILDSVKK